MMEGNADFQLGVSENVNNIIFLCNFKDPPALVLSMETPD